ncbi:MAG: hypothetical protein A2Z47_04470 [Thermodesulfovibrio sp. RBG_19FT_COMBO_42_12]|nr:MAG: hypothetical protein A2Z47_04470 [Thermodesulfovibrio sp. RBG_19FT_COMBO_42_12]HZX48162.1 hypothetical protein [Nitrospirota bacterium]
MKKLLFPISERDYFTTMGRISYLIRDLSKAFAVELLTISKDVYDDVNNKIGGGDFPNMHVTFTESKYLPTTYDFRNDLCKIFVKYTHDIFIPGTDLKIWKTTAFDDFWGHITGCSFPEITKIDADMVLMPLMSHDDSPTEETDVFYTTIISMAREAGIKTAGYQIYPVFNTNKLMPRLMDAIIVKSEYERQYYIKTGIAPEKLHLLTDTKDIYSINTIEDTYKNKIYNSQIEIGHNELGIVVVNHGRFRPQLKEIFRVLKETGIPIVLSLVKRDFTIRDLKEDVIIEGVFIEDIKKINCRFYLVETQSLVPVVMISDIVISPTYVTPLEFATQYGKEALVYNPFYAPMPDVNGITFINNLDDLMLSVKKAYSAKQDTVGLTGIINSIL